LDEDVAGYKKIGVFGNGAGQRVFDGDDGGTGRAVLYAVEYFGRAGAGNHLAAGQHLFGGFVAEGSAFALDGGFDGLHDLFDLRKVIVEAGKCKWGGEGACVQANSRFLTRLLAVFGMTRS
jgi:hypothetical protein